MSKQIDELIEEFRQKNYQDFDHFYELTNKQVYYAIITIVKSDEIAADLMQDTYMNFLNKIHQFKKGGNVYAYLSKIGRNLSINYYHKYKKEIHSNGLIETFASDEKVSEYFEIDITTILDLLNDDQREVIVLRVINELKFREVADATGKPLGTVLWLYQEAIKKLKEKVGG